MAAPAHYLADSAKREAKEYADRLIKELRMEIVNLQTQLEERIAKLESK